MLPGDVLNAAAFGSHDGTVVALWNSHLCSHLGLLHKDKTVSSRLIEGLPRIETPSLTGTLYMSWQVMCFSPSHQILNNFLDALLGGLHAFLCSLQRDPLTVDTCTRETDSDSAVLLCQLPQHLTSPAHKVPMMADVDLHAVLHHIILEQQRISSFKRPFRERSKNAAFRITKFLTRFSSSFWA